MAKPVELANGRSWKTRKDALQHFKDMLGRYASGDRIPAGPDHDDLCALLSHYDGIMPPGYETKAGSGVAYFSKEPNGGEGYTTDRFHVNRTDGSKIDFSYIRAINDG